MSKNLFLELREHEISQLYPSTFTKKEALATGTKLAYTIIENGNISKHTALSNLLRLEAVISSAIDNLKESVSDIKTTEMGIDFTPTNGRKIVQYSEDPIWVELQKNVKDREALINLAQSQETADLYGNIVPKVSIKYGKNSLNIKF
jgi:hypothetical protein